MVLTVWWSFNVAVVAVAVTVVAARDKLRERRRQRLLPPARVVRR